MNQAPAPVLDLPPSDSKLSPLTGYTRAHWLCAADGLLQAANSFMSPGRARIALPGRASFSGSDSDQVEGFARTFLMLAFRCAGEPGEALPGLLDGYATGIANGTNPGHPEAWPALAQDCRQMLVEACSIALGLHLTRRWLWDQFDSGIQERIAVWLQGAFGLQIPDNNWHLFRVIVGEFLASINADHDRAEMDADLARVEQFYVGDGWYRDGPGDNFDHYCGWALHTYPVLLSLLLGDADSTRMATVRSRLRRFLSDFVLFFGADGPPMHQGRSLIYRFAAVAAPWLGALVQATPLSPGATRRLASGSLRHFIEHGFTNQHGIATLGWYHAYPPMVQRYSGPGSPYWLAKGFAGLLLPADHPCWTAVEEPLPTERQDIVRGLKAPGFVVTTTRADGIARLANHGSDNHPPLSGIDDPHYSRLGYSTVTAPMLSPADGQLADNHVGLIHPDLGLSHRARIHRIAIADGYGSSWHTPTWGVEAGIQARIETASVLSGAWELRAHLVEAPTKFPLHDSGWQVASDTAPITDASSGYATATTVEGLTSTIISAHGHDQLQVAVTNNTSAYGHTAATPFALARRTSERTVHVMLLGLNGFPTIPTEKILCTVDGSTVVAQLPDHSWVLIALGLHGADAPMLDGHRLNGRIRFARSQRGQTSIILPA